jgi:hypothetical protein
VWRTAIPEVAIAVVGYHGLRPSFSILDGQLCGAEEALVDLFGAGVGIETEISQPAFIPSPQGHDPIPCAEASRWRLALAKKCLQPQLVVDDAVEQGLEDLQGLVRMTLAAEDLRQGDARPGHLLLLNEAEAFSLHPGEGFRIVGVAKEVPSIRVNCGA